MSQQLVGIPYLTLRSLYGRLLAVAPTFMDVPMGGVLYDASDRSLELRVLGSIGSFRRLELLRLFDIEADEMEPSPHLQIICQTDLQAARVVMYTEAHAYPSSYFCSSAEVLSRPDRIVTALALHFFGELIEQGRSIETRNLRLLK